MADELSTEATRDCLEGEELRRAKMENTQQLELEIWSKPAPALKSELTASLNQVHVLTAEREVMLRDLESEAAAITSLRDENKSLIATKERLEFSVQALQSRLKRVAEEAESPLALLADKDRESFKLSELNVKLDKRVRELEERESNAEQHLQSLKGRLGQTAAQLQTAIVDRDCLVGEVEKLHEDALRMKEEQRLQGWEHKVSMLQHKLDEGSNQIDALHKERSTLWRDLESREAEVHTGKDANVRLTAAKDMFERSAQALQAKVNRLTEEVEFYRASGPDNEANCRSAHTKEDLETQVRDIRHREAVGEQQLQCVRTRLEETAAELRMAIACRDGLLLEVEKLQEEMHASTLEQQRLKSLEQDYCTLQRKLHGCVNQVDLHQKEISALCTKLEGKGAELTRVKDENKRLMSSKEGIVSSMEALEAKLGKLLQESETNKSEMEEKDRFTSRLAEENVSQAKQIKELKERESILDQRLNILKSTFEKTSDELRTAIASRNDLTLMVQKLQEQENCTKLERAQESQCWKESFSSLEGQLKQSATCLARVQSERADVLRDLEVTETVLTEVKNENTRLLAAKDMAESFVESWKPRLARLDGEAEKMRSEAVEKDNRMARLAAENLDLEKRLKEQGERESLAEQRLHALKVKLDETAHELQTSVVTRDCLVGELETLQENIRGMVMEQEERRQGWEQSVSSFQRKANESVEQIEFLQNERTMLLRDLESRETDLEGLKDQCESLLSANETLECSVTLLQSRLETLVKEVETNRSEMEGKDRETCRLLELNVNLEKAAREQREQVGLAEQCIQNLKKNLEETTAQLQSAIALRDNLGEEIEILQEQAGCLKLEQERQSEAWEQKLLILQRRIRETGTELDSARSERAALLKDLECRECELKLLGSENRQLVAAKEAAQFLVQTLQDKLTRALDEAEANKAGIEEIGRNLEAAEEKAATRRVQLEELRVKIENGDRVSERLVKAEGELQVLQSKLFEADQLVRDKEDSLAASEWTVQHLATEISKAKSSLVQKDKKEATLQQQLEDLEMQLRSKEGDIIEIDCYLQQQLKCNRQQQAELDKLSQKMQEMQKGAADWLKKESEMKGQVRCLEDALEERDTSLGKLQLELKVKAEMREAMEGAIDSLKVQLANAEKECSLKENEMESLCDDLEGAKQDASLAATQLKDLQSRMQQLDVILGQVAATKEREQLLEQANRNLQHEATKVQELSLTRKNKLVQVLEQLERNRAVNRALHVQMTSTHKRILDDLNTNRMCPESCDELWSEQALGPKCKKLRRSGDLTSCSSESLSDTLGPQPAESVTDQHIVSSDYLDGPGTTSIEQVGHRADLSAVADDNLEAVTLPGTKVEEVSEPPVTELETALSQLSVQRITIGHLHQEVVRLKSDLLHASTATETKVGEAGNDRDFPVKAISPEEYTHYLELCDSLVRKNITLEKKVEAMERKSRGLQKQLEAYRISDQAPSENDPGQDQGSPLKQQNRLGKKAVEDATESSWLRQLVENPQMKTPAGSEYLAQKGACERPPLQELRSGAQSPSVPAQANLKWQNLKLQGNISRS